MSGSTIHCLGWYVDVYCYNTVPCLALAVLLLQLLLQQLKHAAMLALPILQLLLQQLQHCAMLAACRATTTVSTTTITTRCHEGKKEGESKEKGKVEGR